MFDFFFSFFFFSIEPSFFLFYKDSSKLIVEPEFRVQYVLIYIELVDHQR